MSTSNPRPWDTGEAPAQKTDPWMAFGLTLVVSVACILFAAGTWIVRSNQANKAVERASLLRTELTETEQKRKALEQTSTEQQAQLAQLTADKTTLTEQVARANAEIVAARRELAGVQGTLTANEQSDSNPKTLPFGRLRQALADRTIGVEVHVQGDNVPKGPILEFAKVQLGSGWQIQQTGRSTLSVSVVAASAGSDLRSVAVLLELRQDWKVPGSQLRFPVTIWRNHTVGVMPEERTQSLIEEMLSDLFKSLDTQLAG